MFDQTPTWGWGASPRSLPRGASEAEGPRRGGDADVDERFVELLTGGRDRIPETDHARHEEPGIANTLAEVSPFYPFGSTFDPILANLMEEGLGAYNWGFVAGKTQTNYPWDSWQKKYGAERSDYWIISKSASSQERSK
ncbi:MAG: hypothetical protein ACK48M_02885 [Planctomycetia bacterium]